MNTAPWTCPNCGMQATANLDALGPLGTILCTCGARSRPAKNDAPATGLVMCWDDHDGTTDRPHYHRRVVPPAEG